MQDKHDGFVQIIVVDDEPSLRLGFQCTLTSRTTVVSTAQNGRVAIEMLANGHYDLMILDLRMPEMDGIDVLKAVRASGNPIPIILCSAGFTLQSALEAIRNGVVDFLLKPLRPMEIRNAVQSLLSPMQGSASGSVECALEAVRNGEPGEAIRILDHITEPSPRGVQWLHILQTIKDTEPGSETTLVDTLDVSLPLLAMNTQTIP